MASSVRDTAGLGPALLCVAIAAVAMAAALLSVTRNGQVPAAAIGRHFAMRASVGRRAGGPPVVEPTVLLEMTPDRARAINAARPFAAGTIAAARPFTFIGTAEEKEKAITCLASAAWYEAGDDPDGQRAVVQVILNRLRHPAYPKTICGVVFEGSERRTGCQFTFTCDGSLRRIPPAEGWQRARGVADKALSGFVEPAVGTATHYHTDWVVPYWAASLDKIARVHTQLFYRWPGWWGQRAAFAGRYQGPEMLDPRLAYLAAPVARNDADATALADLATPEESAAPHTAIAVAGVSARQLKGNIVRLASDDGIEFALQLNPAAPSASYAAVAAALCRSKPACMVMGWIKPQQVPAALPAPVPAIRTVSFLYRRNEQFGLEQTFWNCRQFARANDAYCLPGTQAGPAPPAGAASG